MEEVGRGAGSAGAGTPSGQPCPRLSHQQSPGHESLREEASACDLTPKASSFVSAPSQPLFPSLGSRSGPTCHKRLPSWAASLRFGGSQPGLSRVTGSDEDDPQSPALCAQRKGSGLGGLLTALSPVVQGERTWFLFPIIFTGGLVFPASAVVHTSYHFLNTCKVFYYQVW